MTYAICCACPKDILNGIPKDIPYLISPSFSVITPTYIDAKLNQSTTQVNYLSKLNPFSTNVPLMDKPGSWFLLAKCLKNTCGSDILSKDTGRRSSTFIFTWNVSLPLVFFKHFASKNQLHGFYIIGTLVENGFNYLTKKDTVWKKLTSESNKKDRVSHRTKAMESYFFTVKKEKEIKKNGVDWINKMPRKILEYYTIQKNLIALIAARNLYNHEVKLSIWRYQ